MAIRNTTDSVNLGTFARSSKYMSSRSPLFSSLETERGTRSERRPVSGGYTGGATPVPISNTEVKPSRVDGTAGETLWESRTPPEFSQSVQSDNQVEMPSSSRAGHFAFRPRELQTPPRPRRPHCRVRGVRTPPRVRGVRTPPRVRGVRTAASRPPERRHGRPERRRGRPHGPGARP